MHQVKRHHGTTITATNVKNNTKHRDRTQFYRESLCENANSRAESQFRLFDYQRFSRESLCENVNRLFVTRLAIIILLRSESESRSAQSGTTLYRGPVAKRELYTLCVLLSSAVFSVSFLPFIFFFVFSLLMAMLSGNFCNGAAGF